MNKKQGRSTVLIQDPRLACCNPPRPSAISGYPTEPFNVALVSRQIYAVTDTIKLRFYAPAVDVAGGYSFKFTYYRIWGDSNAAYTEVTGLVVRDLVKVEPEPATST